MFEMGNLLSPGDISLFMSIYFFLFKLSPSF